MYKIAICDDDLTLACQLESILLDLCKQYQIDLESEVFTSGQRLLQILDKDGYFDIVFLDIEMAGVDGILAGRYIRQEQGDLETLIV